jgi:serine/threonine protein kinase
VICLFSEPIQRMLNSIANNLITNSDSAELLGSGGSGKVYKIDDMVVKKMDISESEVETFNKEVGVWATFSAFPELKPYIPDYLGKALIKTKSPAVPSSNLKKTNPEEYNRQWAVYISNIEPNYYGFIFQKFEPVIDMGEFIDRFKRGFKFDFNRGYALFNNIVKGFDEMHNAGYIHRDIKPGNILIRLEPGDITMPIIIDFGMVCKLPCEPKNNCLINDDSPYGTNYYLPQNVLSNKNRLNEFKKQFPVTKKLPTMWTTFKNAIFCRRRKTRKGPNTISVKTANIKIKGFYNIASDNYALGLTLQELHGIIYWTGKEAEKKAAEDKITKLKSQILPYLAAKTASKKYPNKNKKNNNNGL